MATPKTVSGERKSRFTRARILTAAEEMFASRGYDNTSLRDLTAKAKVNLSVVYYYFDSKEELLLACVEKYVRPMLDRELDMLVEAQARAHGAAVPLRELIEITVLAKKFSSPETTQRLQAMVLSLSSRMARKVFNACEEMTLTVRSRMLEAFIAACPQLTPIEVRLRYTTLNAAMFGLQSFVPHLRREFPKDIPDEAYFKMLVAALVALFRAEAVYDEKALEKWTGAAGAHGGRNVGRGNAESDGNAGA